MFFWNLKKNIKYVFSNTDAVPHVTSNLGKLAAIYRELSLLSEVAFEFVCAYSGKLVFSFIS